jgi:hypothetical protein
MLIHGCLTWICVLYQLHFTWILYLLDTCHLQKMEVQQEICAQMRMQYLINDNEGSYVGSILNKEGEFCRCGIVSTQHPWTDNMYSQRKIMSLFDLAGNIRWVIPL